MFFFNLANLEKYKPKVILNVLYKFLIVNLPEIFRRVRGFGPRHLDDIFLPKGNQSSANL